MKEVVSGSFFYFDLGVEVEAVVTERLREQNGSSSTDGCPLDLPPIVIPHLVP